ncbi:MAG: hypothetical protein ACKO7P_07380 [Bacteroidota bacterium]
MKKNKILVDRIELTKEEIAKRQNFNEIIQKINFSKSMLKSPWFYGAIGFSALLGFIILLSTNFVL